MKIKSLFTPSEIDKHINEFKTLTEKNYYYFEGTNNIIISSIHGFDHIKKDKVKPKDSGTVLFSFLLSKITNSSFICVFENNLNDNNYYAETPVKKFLLDNHNISHKIMIDIHGTHAYRIPDIEIGTMFNKTISEEKNQTIKEILTSYHLLFVENETFAAMGEDEFAETMTSFAKNKLNIESFQIEINSSLINGEQSLCFSHRYYQLLNCFGQIITSLNYE